MSEEAASPNQKHVHSDNPVHSEDSVHSENPVATAGLQFRLSTIFVLTLVASILAAFLNPKGSDMLLAGMATTAVSLLFALVIGYFRSSIADRVFWAVVVAAMMQAVAANVILLDRSGIYAWPIVAGFAAAIAAGKSNLYFRMLAASATAAVTIIPYVVSLEPKAPVILSYVTCAAIGGALLTIMIDLVRWAEQKHRIPQPAIGLTLVIAAIGFSVLAPQLIPGW